MTLTRLRKMRDVLGSKATPSHVVGQLGWLMDGSVNCLMS